MQFSLSVVVRLQRKQPFLWMILPTAKENHYFRINIFMNFSKWAEAVGTWGCWRPPLGPTLAPTFVRELFWIIFQKKKTKFGGNQTCKGSNFKIQLKVKIQNFLATRYYGCDLWFWVRMCIFIFKVQEYGIWLLHLIFYTAVFLI
jgi:hypothetical protein